MYTNKICIENTTPAGRRGCSVHVPGAVPHPSSPTVYIQQPWKNFVASLATDKEAPMRKLAISADLHDIKIIKKEGRLKGKWL